MDRLLVGIAIAVAALVLGGGFLRDVAAAEPGLWIASAASGPMSQKAESLPF